MLDNKNLYNDKELIDEADLDWYDYGFRNYDPQIGRFPQLDPLTDDYPELTNYQYASCEPIANVDIDGLEALGVVGTQTGVITAQSALKEITVSIKIGAKSSSGFFSVTGNFFKGIGQSAWGLVKGVGQVIAHPVNTAQNLGNLMTQSPLVTGLSVYNAASQTYDEFKNGNGDTKANIAGNVVGDVAQLFIGTGELKAATKVVEISKIVEETEILADIGKAGKLTSEAEGGLNLYKFHSIEVAAETGWKTGDRFLNLPKATSKLTWKQNFRLLRQEIKSGKPIYDSYRNVDGTLKETGGFLNLERNYLKSRGWKYSSNDGAWMSPH